jgi:hypothetical protein
MDRKTEDRILRIYWILSIIGLVGPACYIVGFVLLASIFGGVALPGAIGIMYVLGIVVKYFPMLLSPISIVTALIMKFRYDIEMIWPLMAAILFYSIHMYFVIESWLL